MSKGIIIPVTLQSKRTKLEICKIEDAPKVYEAICESLTEFRKWLIWAKKPQSVELCEENIHKAIQSFEQKSDIRYHIFKDEYFIGIIGVHNIEWEIPKLEIGYWIRSSYQKNGYATEAVSMIVNLAFHVLAANRVEIRCDERNIKSRRIPEKLNFVLEGIHRYDTLTPEGHLRNTAVYSKIKEDYLCCKS